MQRTNSLLMIDDDKEMKHIQVGAKGEIEEGQLFANSVLEVVVVSVDNVSSRHRGVSFV
jgi:hypothetical protein